VKLENFAAETNECLLRLVSFAIWSSRLYSNDDLFEAVRLFCSFTHVHELVLESCYLYCYAIRLLIVNGKKMNEAYNEMMLESERRAKITGFSTFKYWLQNDVEIGEEELPKPHFRPVSYVKVSILWAFYYLKHEFDFEDAIRDIIKRGGDTMANASIVGGLIGAAHGAKNISQQYKDLVLANKESDIESQPRGHLYQPRTVIDLDSNKSVFHQMITKAPSNLTVIWDK